MNGDGLEDYMVVDPDNGAVNIWWNWGPDDDWGGIATGAVSDITTLVFADGVPLYINQGPAKTIANGITQLPSSIKLADLDSNGKDDYAYINDNGVIWLWWNRGTTDSLTALDNIRFADIDSDGLDDYIWLDTSTRAPTMYYDDYIFLHPNGGTSIYRNVYSLDTPLTDWRALSSADASSISRLPS
ncbi:hypothetical protein QBC46DRAFT_346545 [Diplogelasinospora grovesii]|uniref:Uncharacterized protein n=1 Tax=Diplogelasinospora grovesii TaxID=303347 RepID=A0AAN6N0C6_9PEZI|nr:hypothetical protein QBC46DRAFT_346545 [Diplogelasinospora grovesii]